MRIRGRPGRRTMFMFGSADVICSRVHAPEFSIAEDCSQFFSFVINYFNKVMSGR